jgi:hypothetical protein
MNLAGTEMQEMHRETMRLLVTRILLPYRKLSLRIKGGRKGSAKKRSGHLIENTKRTLVGIHVKYLRDWSESYSSS